MIVKCNDYLPNKTGFYNTDLGKIKFELHFKHLGVWYYETNEKYFKTFRRAYPFWWEEDKVQVSKKV